MLCKDAAEGSAADNDNIKGFAAVAGAIKRFLQGVANIASKDVSSKCSVLSSERHVISNELKVALNSSCAGN